MSLQGLDSKLYININIKQHKSKGKMKVRGGPGGQAMMKSFFVQRGGFSRDDGR